MWAIKKVHIHFTSRSFSSVLLFISRLCFRCATSWLQLCAGWQLWHSACCYKWSNTDIAVPAVGWGKLKVDTNRTPNLLFTLRGSQRQICCSATNVFIFFFSPQVSMLRPFNCKLVRDPSCRTPASGTTYHFSHFCHHPILFIFRFYFENPLQRRGLFLTDTSHTKNE